MAPEFRQGLALVWNDQVRGYLSKRAQDKGMMGNFLSWQNNAGAVVCIAITDTVIKGQDIDVEGSG